jgi:hypothetical protein
VLCDKALSLLLGDLAITSLNRSQGFGGRLPTVGKALGPHGKLRGRYLTGFTQKICVLGPRLAIGWADSPHAARVVLKAAQERYGSTGVDSQEMSRFLSQIGYKNGKIGRLGLSIIGLSLVDDYVSHVFSFGGGKMIEDDQFGTLRAIGSGSEHLLQNLQKFDDTLTNGIPEIYNVICRMLSYVGTALITELLSAGTLKDFFGGGFELAFP